MSFRRRAQRRRTNPLSASATEPLPLAFCLRGCASTKRGNRSPLPPTPIRQKRPSHYRDGCPLVAESICSHKQPHSTYPVHSSASNATFPQSYCATCCILDSRNFRQYHLTLSPPISQKKRLQQALARDESPPATHRFTPKAPVPTASQTLTVVFPTPSAADAEESLAGSSSTNPEKPAASRAATPSIASSTTKPSAT